jgi:catechol 2,3-dioxygenase-like lactoylglutathione lyase family enzyme
LSNKRANDPTMVGIHHVQITCPLGEVETARRFYSDVLGFAEVPKPASLAGRGGLWLSVGALQLHIGVEDGINVLAMGLNPSPSGETLRFFGLL